LFHLQLYINDLKIKGIQVETNDYPIKYNEELIFLKAVRIT